MRPPKSDQSYALITGASSGIGADLAREYAKRGIPSILIARRLERLEALKLELREHYQVECETLSLDLQLPDAADLLLTFLNSKKLKISVLINNAGFGLTGAFLDLPLPRQLEMMQVNMNALVSLNYKMIPLLKQNPNPKILNVGSTAGFLPGPYMAIYYATKAFVNSFSEALGEELSEQGILVSVLCPGPVATEFRSVAGSSKSKAFDGALMQSPEVAIKALAGLDQKQRVIIPGRQFQALIQALRFAPRSAVRSFAAKRNRPG